MKKPDELSNAHLSSDEIKKRYNDLYDLAPIGYFTLTCKGVIRETNLKGAELLGIIPQKLINRGFGSFVQSCDLGIWDHYILSLFQEGEKQSCELGLKREDGSILFVRLDSTLIEKMDSGPQVHIAMTDITRIKQARHNQDLSVKILGILSESDALPDAINSILIAIQQETGFDAVGIRLRSGDDFPYFVQNGFSYDCLLTENTLTVRDQNGGICRDKNGKPFLECTCGLVISGKTDPTNPLFTPGGSAWTNNSLPLLDLPAAQDPRLHPRNRCIHDGFCSFALIPVRANQEIVGLLQLNDRKKDRFTLEMIQFFEGISASIGVALMRKLAEDAMRESDQKARAILDLSFGFIGLLTPEGTLLEANRSALEFAGIQLSEVIGKPFWETPWWSHTPETQNQIQEAVKSAAKGMFVRMETTHPTKDGMVRNIDFTLKPVINEKGQITFLIPEGRDITEHKHAEEEREKLAAREQVALAEAEAARKLDRLKSEFLQTMSHELRTPMNAILGFSDLIKMKTHGELNEKQELYINHISNSAKHLLGIINEILDLVKVESGEKLPLSIELFLAQEAIDESVGFLYEKALQKNIVLKKEIDPELEIILADRTRFKQILINLIDNAIKFSKPQGGTVIIAGRKADDIAQFSVCDTGIGIKEENLGNIFSLFYQADSGISRKYGGTGIGLAIIKQLVEQHGGRLWVRSKHGEGTTFTFTLPLEPYYHNHDNYTN